MTKVIAFANQKGGVGKTTCVQNMGIGIANKGKKVLLIDADAQANLTLGLNENPDELENTISVLLSEMQGKKRPPSIQKYIIHSGEKVDLLPSDMNLSGVEISLQSLNIDREFLIKEIVDELRDKYDYIFIDCPPSLGIMTLNALVAADEVIIPTQAQLYSVKGSSLLVENIYAIQQRLNINLKINGIIVTMINARTKNTQQLIMDIQKIYGEHVRIFKDYIPQSIKASESTYEGKSVFLHDPNGKVALAYNACIEEFLNG